jgi:hypothetical protein
MLITLLISCGTNPTESSSANADTTARSDNPDSADHRQSEGTENHPHAHHSHENDTDDSTNDESIATYFIVVADTGQNYYTLHKKMFELNKQFRIQIDTMDRSYNEKKNLIALSENDDDKLYAGEYFPRRFPSDHLSLEYLDVYQTKAGKKTIALVAGIYEKQKSADSALSILHASEKKVFKIKANIFTGCAH